MNKMHSTLTTTMIVLVAAMLASFAAAQVPEGINQTFLTDRYEPDASTASAGFASTVGSQGTWAGFHNPAAWAGQPLIHSGVATTDLWNFSDSARLECGAAGIGFGGVFGIGYSRTSLRFAGPDDPDFILPTPDSSANEVTDVYGAGLDLAGLLAPHNDYMNLSVGMNVKLQERSYLAGSEDPRVVTEEYMNYDFGGLAEFRIPLAQDQENLGDDPISFLELRGSRVLRNANRDRFKEDSLGINHEVGLTRTQGYGLSLVLGKVNADRHIFRISAGLENWTFEQEMGALDRNDFDLMEEEGRRMGLEIGLADVLFARTGRVSIDGKGYEENTYGLGLQVKIPALSFKLRADYARAPWLYGGEGGIVDTDGAPIMEKFTLQVALGI